MPTLSHSAAEQLIALLGYARNIKIASIQADPNCAARLWVRYAADFAQGRKIAEMTFSYDEELGWFYGTGDDKSITLFTEKKGKFTVS